LKHLGLGCSLGVSSFDPAAEVTQLMSNLKQLQQLTHLELLCSYPINEEDNMQLLAASHSALTASSKLVHLDLSCSSLPAGVWQHVFPTGRQLPHLRSLNISRATELSAARASAPEGSHLVSCCPGLQFLDIQGLKHSAQALAALHGLSELSELRLTLNHWNVQDTVDVLGKLTWLRELGLEDHCTARSLKKGMLLPLTQLKQLTTLICSHHPDNEIGHLTIMK
jgi:hypothetical protein